MTTTPAGRVSRESVREMIEGECAYYANHSGVARSICESAIKALAELPSAELPAIGVSDAQRLAKLRSFLTSGHIHGPGHGTRFKMIEICPMSGDELEFSADELFKALEAALRQSGEDL